MKFKEFIYKILNLKSKESCLEFSEAYETVLKKTNIKPNFFLEIGSRDGNDALKITKRFDLKEDNVHVVEAHPTCYENIKKDYPNFNVYNFAIFDKEGDLSFNSIEIGDKGISSIRDRYDNYYEEKAIKITIKSKRGSSFLRENANGYFDLCKIDVEGCTLEVLKSFNGDLYRIKTMHIECEHRKIWQNQYLFDDVSDYLKAKGFVCLYFAYVSKYKYQSDSIWVNKDYIL